MAKVKAYSDKYLIKLWRDAVLIKNGNRCFLCGQTDIKRLECHHIVKRRNKILRYDYRNGVPVCAWSCHSQIDSIRGRMMINEQRPFDVIHLTEFENMTMKEYLMKNEITENEFLLKKYDELRNVIRCSA